MIRKTIPVTLFTGYLGSGKTTLLNNVLHNTEGYRAAVIVNDIGEVNIDESLITGNGGGAEKVIPLSNGCICCTLRKDMVRQIRELVLTEKYDHILMEASGICEPAPISNAVSNLKGARLDNIVTVVDALRLADEFGCGEKLVRSYDETHNIVHRPGAGTAPEDDIERLLVQQIEFCTTVIINKTDTVTREQLAAVREAVKHLQPDANVLETTFCQVALNRILDTDLFDFDTVYKSAGWIQAMQEAETGKPETEEYGISTFVYTSDQPFIRTRFELWTKQLPSSLIRCKGVIWFTDAEERSYIFEQAGKELMTREFGRWNGGNGMIKLVFIGRRIDRKKLEMTLDQCLEKR